MGSMTPAAAVSDEAARELPLPVGTDAIPTNFWLKEEEIAMKKVLGVAVAAAVVLGISGAALAWMGGPGMGYGYGPGMMGWGGGYGPGAGYGPRGGWGPCRGAWGGYGGYGPQGPAGTSAPAAIDESKAKELATDYVNKNLPGYKVDRLVKFDMPRGAMYQVEAKGPKDEIAYLRINPFGYVIPFGQGRAR